MCHDVICPCFVIQTSMMILHLIYVFQPWEDRMKDAHEQGRLVLLKNLDPTYTSTDVEVREF